MPDALFELGWDRPVYDGRPLVFTTDVLTLDQMSAMTTEYWARRAGMEYRPARLWAGSKTHEGDGMPRHTVNVVHVDLRCEWHLSHPEGWPNRRPRCSCVGSMVYRALCSCGWHGEIRSTENAAAEDWCDEHWPGWRDLPPVPIRLRPSEPTVAQRAAYRAWLEQHYPPAFLEPGAPVRTQRSPLGTRHVPNGSPFHGYDLAVAVYACDVTWIDLDERLPHVLHRCVFNGPNHQRHECGCGCPEPATEPEPEP